MKHSFTTGEVARLSGVLPGSLHQWDRKGYLTPSILCSEGKGTDRLWSLADAVLAYLIGRSGGIERRTFVPLIAFLQVCPEPWPAYAVMREGRISTAETAEEAVAIAWKLGSCWVVNLGEARRHVVETEAATR